MTSSITKAIQHSCPSSLFPQLCCSSQLWIMQSCQSHAGSVCFKCCAQFQSQIWVINYLFCCCMIVQSYSSQSMCWKLKCIKKIVWLLTHWNVCIQHFCTALWTILEQSPKKSLLLCRIKNVWIWFIYCLFFLLCSSMKNSTALLKDHLEFNSNVISGSILLHIHILLSKL